jgi:hypothetical protein
VSPVRPFDVLLEDYITAEAEELTGVAVNGSMVYVQFEAGAVIGFNISKDEPACHHFIASVQRGENEVPRDLFEFKPTFAKLPSGTRESAPVNWEAVMPGVAEPPPASLLYKLPEIEIGDAGTPGCFCDLDEAFEFRDGDVAEALSLFWRNHLAIAKTMQ